MVNHATIPGVKTCIFNPVNMVLRLWLEPDEYEVRLHFPGPVIVTIIRLSFMVKFFVDVCVKISVKMEMFQ